MGLIDRSAIAAPALPFEDIDVPEIGGTVRVLGLLLADRLKLAEEAQALESKVDLMAFMLARTVVAGDGLPVFTFDEWCTFQAAHEEPTGRLWAVAARLNGLALQEQKKS